MNTSEVIVMMVGYGGMGLWWLWLLMVVVGIGALVWGVTRATSSGGRRPDAGPGSAPEILRERFARGEISEQELREGLRVLDER